MLLLERLPADAELYLCIDESRLPRLRKIARSFARFMRVFQDEAIRRAQGRLGAGTLAYATIQADLSRFLVPLVIGHLGGVRLHAAALAMPLLEAPAGFFGQADTALICAAEYDRETFVEHVTELALSGARPRLPIAGPGPVRLDVLLPASRGKSSPLHIELDERRIELGTERTGTPLGKSGAGNLLAHWEQVLPALDAVRVHARIAEVGVLDAGFAQDASSVHLEVVLECPDETRAQRWLELVRERIAGLSERDPESAGVLLNPLVLARLALHEFGEPKLSRIGRHLRAVITRSGTLDDLLAQLVEDFASFASNLREKR